MEYIGKKGGWFTYRYSPGHCKQYYFPLSKMIEKLEKIKSLQQKRRFNRLMKEDASGNLLGSTVYFGKVGLT